MRTQEQKKELVKTVLGVLNALGLIALGIWALVSIYNGQDERPGAPKVISDGGP